MSTRSTRRAKRATQNAPQPKNAAPNATAPNATAPLFNAPENRGVENGDVENSDIKSAAPKILASKFGAQNTRAENAQTQNAQIQSASSKSNASAAKKPSPKSPVPDARNARFKAASSTRLAPTETAATATNVMVANDISPAMWRVLAWSVLAVAAVLRLWNLSLVPFHHDEGVNGDFLKTLFTTGAYKYNPENFHGPTLYYFSLVSSYLSTFLVGKSGFGEIALRLVPVCFGIGVVALVLSLRRHLGTWATLCGALLLAVSPGMVYVSRYFIHEMHFVFFTLLTVVATLHFRPRGAWFWPALVSLVVAGSLSSHTVVDAAKLRGIEPLTLTMVQFLILSWGLGGALTQSRATGNWNWALVAVASMAMLFGSKETAPISLVVLLFAGALTWLLCDFKIGRAANDARLHDGRLHAAPSSDGRLHDRRMVFLAFGALVVFWALTAAMFSSFERSYVQEGMTKFFAAYDVWRKTGASDFQAKPLLTYAVWMLTIEPAIFVLGMGGAVLALWQRRSRFAVFVALWALGLFAAYSLIPYKTPWLMINFVVPFALTSGLFIQQIALAIGARAARSSPSSTRFAPCWNVALLAAPAIILTTVQMRFLNFIDYDNDDTIRYAPTLENPQGEIVKLGDRKTTRDGKEVDFFPPAIKKLLPGDIKKYPYIYVHTQRGYSVLMHKIDELATLSGLGKKMPIMVTSSEYWPMPWSLRDYGVGYYGRVQPPTNEPVVIGRTDPDDRNSQYNQDEELTRVIGSRFVRTGEYPLRPSVTLTLWVRRDLAIQMKPDDVKSASNS